MKKVIKLDLRLFVVYIIILILGAFSVLAHVSTPDVIPKLVEPGESYDFDVTFDNSGPSVDEIRIYLSEYFENFTCDEKEGWSLTLLPAPKEGCFYLAKNSSYWIDDGESQTFEFSTKLADDANGDCIAQMQFETRDINDEWHLIIYSDVIIDRFNATIIKTMFGEYEGDCPPGEDDECYVKGDGFSGANVLIQDTGDICENYDMLCEYEVWWLDEPVESGEFSDEVNITFSGDSRHDLIITCEDGFGNVLYDSEPFLVDIEPPTTEKVYGEPFIESCNDGLCIEWISNLTQITFNAEDEKVGVDETYWKATLVDDDLCYNPKSCYQRSEIIGKIDLSEEDKIAYWEDYVFGSYTNKVLLGTVGGEATQGFINHRTYEFAIPISNLDAELGDDIKLGFYTLDGKHKAIHRIANHYPSTNQPSFPWYDNSNWFDYMLADDGTPITVDGNLSDWSEMYLFTECDAYDQSTDSSRVHCFDAYATVYGGMLYVAIDYTDDITDDVGVTGAPNEDGVKIIFSKELEYEVYENPVSIDEESCHLIEFFSIDKFGYEERINWQCAFVDTSAPDVTKEIGEPKVIDGDKTYITQQTAITLRCEDVLPHPVGDVSLWYRSRISDDCENWSSWGQWIDPNGYLVEKVINFEEDSCHELEYYCEDAVGNLAGIFSEIDIVDTQAPVINRTIEGPSYLGECPYLKTVIQCADEKCYLPEECLYVDNATTFVFDVEDPQPHPVGDVMCDWYYSIYGDPVLSGEGVMPPFNVTFPEESEHMLMVMCEDALGNTEWYYEMFIADHTPPVTEKSYGEPMHDHEGYPIWITSETPITMSAYDPEPHPSGVNETLYRVSLVEDGYCAYDRELDCENAIGNGSFSVYEDSFTISEDSCHLIEYYSVDNVNKTEEIKKQCVYVDNQGPMPNKTIGLPKSQFGWDIFGDVFYNVSDKCWNGEEDQIECWKTTILTPLYLECDDPEPHPVDHENVCFKVGLDGDDATQDYCEKYQGAVNDEGYCCVRGEITPFYFDETTYHNLDYYCVDALGNVGPNDDQKFKVEETSFNIMLNKKWNLISTPVKLLDDSMDEVFKDLSDSVKSVWTYDAFTDQWFVYSPDGNSANDNLQTMLPGWGYWVFASEEGNLIIGGSLLSPAMTPPSKQLKGDAWNLIGYYGADGLTSYEGPEGNGKPAECALFSLGNNMFDIGWSSLFSYWELYNPHMWIEFDMYQNMDPGAGYWVLPAEDGVYAPTTTCDGLWS